MTTPLIPPAIDATLVLVRHGESTWIAEDRFQGRRDPPLSPRGERQAALVAARLADPLAAPSLPIPAGPPVAQPGVNFFTQIKTVFINYSGKAERLMIR